MKPGLNPGDFSCRNKLVIVPTEERLLSAATFIAAPVLRTVAIIEVAEGPRDGGIGWSYCKNLDVGIWTSARN